MGFGRDGFFLGEISAPQGWDKILGDAGLARQGGKSRLSRFMAATIRFKAFPRGRKSDMILRGKETGIGSLAGWQEN
jgi:hypothetical protein